MWSGGCQSDALCGRTGFGTEPGGREGEKEEVGIHSALQIRLSFHLPPPTPESSFPPQPSPGGNECYQTALQPSLLFSAHFLHLRYTICSIFVLILQFFIVMKYIYKIYHLSHS